MELGEFLTSQVLRWCIEPKAFRRISISLTGFNTMATTLGSSGTQATPDMSSIGCTPGKKHFITSLLAFRTGIMAAGWSLHYRDHVDAPGNPHAELQLSLRAVYFWGLLQCLTQSRESTQGWNHWVCSARIAHWFCLYWWSETYVTSLGLSRAGA